MICNVTFAVPGGTISAQLVNRPPPRKLFAVIGGTESFAGAAGTGELVERGDGTGRVPFRLN